MDELITVAQLREEIGDPTKDQRFSSYVLDAHLQGVIDRHKKELEAITLALAQQLGDLPLEGRQYVEVTLNTDGLFAVGDIDPQYLPFSPRAMDGQGREMALDPEILVTASTSPFVRRRFVVEGHKVYALPGDVEKIRVLLVTMEDAIKQLAAELIPDVNQRIIAAARAMLADRIAEFERSADEHTD